MNWPLRPLGKEARSPGYKLRFKKSLGVRTVVREIFLPRRLAKSLVLPVKKQSMPERMAQERVSLSLGGRDSLAERMRTGLPAQVPFRRVR